MIKIYGMPTCPDCTYVEEQIKGNDRYQVIDIGAHVKNLKESCFPHPTAHPHREIRETPILGVNWVTQT